MAPQRYPRGVKECLLVKGGPTSVASMRHVSIFARVADWTIAILVVSINLRAIGMVAVYVVG